MSMVQMEVAARRKEKEAAWRPSNQNWENYGNVYAEVDYRPQPRGKGKKEKGRGKGKGKNKDWDDNKSGQPHHQWVPADKKRGN